MPVIDSFNHNELGFKISNSQKGAPLLQQNPSKQYIDNTCACTMVSALYELSRTLRMAELI